MSAAPRPSLPRETTRILMPRKKASGRTSRNAPHKDARRSRTARSRTMPGRGGKTSTTGSKRATSRRTRGGRVAGRPSRKKASRSK